jgi:hypothetical protein
MHYALTEQFMARCLASRTGMEEAEAVETLAVFLEISRAMNLITVQRLEMLEQDAHILDLAGKGIPRATIALRIGKARSVVFEALKRHQDARRLALRVAG